MKLCFDKVNLEHIDIIFSWLAEPFIQEFWDNTNNHKDDILNFVNGRKKFSNYCDGKYVYWIASYNHHPFAMLMTIQETAADHIDDIKFNHLSKTGNTYGIDYMIGDKNYFGKGYGAKTLSKFIDFFRKEFDPVADTFIIDPASDNPKAKHVYMKAGFKHLDDFIMSGNVSGAGKSHHLLVKKFTDWVTPKSVDIDFLTHKINQENPEFGEAYTFGFFIRDDHNQIIAGCNGSVVFGSIYTDQLWVHPDYRKTGLGHKLMTQVHDYGRKAGCTTATVTTMSFQGAKTFYEKLGYTVDFERSGYAYNASCIFLTVKL